MGLTQSAQVIPKDTRIDGVRKRLTMTDEDFSVLLLIFKRFDKESKGFMSSIDFIKEYLHLTPSLFTDAMFDIIETEKPGEISFGEFVDMVCTFSLFESLEMMKYCWYILDRDKVGEVDLKEVEHFIYLMWDHEISSNLTMGIDYLRTLDSGDGRVNFRDMVALHTSYPSVFYPAFRIQATVVDYSMGELWWDNKKDEIAEERDRKRKLEEMKKNKAKADLKKEQERLNEEMVKMKMGWKYYVFFWQRDKARKQIAKIAAINKQLEQEEAAKKQESKNG